LNHANALPIRLALLAWHLLYHAALFETDRSELPQRIAEAEKAILARVKGLFIVNSDHIEEDQILDDALYALRVATKLRVGRSQRCLTL
jgi:hypothetical protein